MTCVLAVLTWLIFRSYSQHQSDAAARWKRRGEQALQNRNAKAAVYDLRTALGYGQDDPGTEVELASALRPGRASLQEAVAYFNTLWEKQPGNGNINLQLARCGAAGAETTAWTTTTRRFTEYGRGTARWKDASAAGDGALPDS